jgi:hypothetical protein
MKKKQTKSQTVRRVRKSIQKIQNTVKPAHAVTSIKQSPVLNSHLYQTVTSIKQSPLLNSHLY